ncbi:MAG: PQQ-binding-like beta-propeller repeat protein, partial [Planctomycetota bacterium]|nr:PQQ-binding-like beta-propeller repeat protein [Planctomycetota bacterium]
SPQIATLAGAPQILIFNHASFAGHDPEDGRVLWEVPWSGRNPNVAQLVPVGDDALIVSAGYGDGCARYRIARDAEGGFTATQAWRSRRLKAKFANFVHRDGSLYGLDDGIFTCVDAADGRRRWKGGRYGHGQLILIGDVLLVMAETGDVVLVEATPAEHREIASLSVFADKTWNSPAFAAPYLLVRNDVEAACFELPLAE